MKKLLTGICASVLAVSFAMPLNAAPVFVANTAPAAGQSDVVQVQDRGMRFDRRHFRRDGNNGFYKGYRGERRYRPGYRQYNGFWFPLAAFAAGALITGAINNQPAPSRRIYRGSLSRAHVEWCYDRYRSYDAPSNTFQPYTGGRQQCYSPYS